MCKSLSCGYHRACCVVVVLLPLRTDSIRFLRERSGFVGMAVDVVSLSVLTDGLLQQQEEISKVNMQKIRGLLSKQAMQKEVLRENLRQASSKIALVEQEKEQERHMHEQMKLSFEQLQQQHAQMRQRLGYDPALKPEVAGQDKGRKTQHVYDLQVLGQSLADQLGRTKCEFQTAREEWDLKQKKMERKLEESQAEMLTCKKKVAELLAQRRCWLEGKGVFEKKISLLEQEKESIRHAAEKAQLRIKLKHQAEVKEILVEHQKQLQCKWQDREDSPKDVIKRSNELNQDEKSESAFVTKEEVAKEEKEKKKANIIFERELKKVRIEAMKQKQECEAVVKELQGRIQELEQAQRQKLKQLATKIELSRHQASIERNEGFKEVNSVVEKQLKSQAEKVEVQQAEVKNTTAKLHELELQLKASKQNTRSVKGKYKEALRTLMGEVETYKSKLKSAKKALSVAESKLQRYAANPYMKDYISYDFHSTGTRQRQIRQLMKSIAKEVLQLRQEKKTACVERNQIKVISEKKLSQVLSKVAKYEKALNDMSFKVWKSDQEWRDIRAKD